MKNILNYIRKFATENNKDLYIVGGYIRDKLINPSNEPQDLDIVYKGDIKNFIDYFKCNGYKIFPLNQEIGRYRIVKGEKVLDISSLKGETIKEDLSKRDFTINAIALNLKNNSIIDPFEGRRHIKNRILTEVSENSIKNDRVRILRGIRIIIKNGMHFSKETENTIKEESKYIKECTKERVFHELMHIISCDEQGNAFDIMDSYGILKNILPYIEEHKTIGMCKYHVEDAFTHMNEAYKIFKEFCAGEIQINNFNLDTLNKYIGEFKLKDYLAFATFNHDIGKYSSYKKLNDKVSFINHDKKGGEIIKEFCNFWGFPKEAKNIIINTVEGHMYPLGLFKSNLKDYKKSFYKFFNKYEEFVPYILVISFCDIYATTNFNPVENEIQRYTKFIEKLLEEYLIYNEIKKNKLVKGCEIKDKFQVEEKEIGNILLKIQEITYRGMVKNKEEAMNFILKRCIMKK